MRPPLLPFPKFINAKLKKAQKTYYAPCVTAILPASLLDFYTSSPLSLPFRVFGCPFFFGLKVFSI